jgi:hypothetical protein
MLITESDHLSPLRGARRLYSSPRIDRELVTDFFMTFTRTEYALKRAGYVEAGWSGEPRIKWDDFARSIGDTLLNSCSPAVAGAISYLSSNPPQKQVVRHGGLAWEPRTSDNLRDPVFLMRSITTVRNNLFHGGKEVRGMLAERDHRLGTFHGFPALLLVTLTPAAKEAAWDPTKDQKSMTWAAFGAFAGIAAAN